MHNRGNTKIVLLAIIVVVLVALFLASVAGDKNKNSAGENIIKEGTFITVSIDGVELQAEVADTKEQRRLGLSGRDGLGKNEALIFLFERAGKHGFWMRDMKFPIDILWLTGNNTIVGITKEAQPESFPEVFYPSEAVITVIEMNAGWIDKNNIDFKSVVTISEE